MLAAIPDEFKQMRDKLGPYVCQDAHLEAKLGEREWRGMHESEYCGGATLEG